MNIITPQNIVGCLAAALVNATDQQRATICSYLNCTPAALIQPPGSGGTLPATAPALGASPFFIQDGNPPVLYVWNGTGYVPATAFAAIVNAVVSLDPQTVIGAICGATVSAVNPLLPVRAIQKGTNGACSIVELAIVKDCNGNLATTVVSCDQFNTFSANLATTLGNINTTIANLLASVPTGTALPADPADGTLPFFAIPNPGLPGAYLLYVWTGSAWALAGDGVGSGGSGGMTAVQANPPFTGLGTASSPLGLNISQLCSLLSQAGCDQSIGNVTAGSFVAFDGNNGNALTWAHVAVVPGVSTLFPPLSAPSAWILVPDGGGTLFQADGTPVSVGPYATEAAALAALATIGYVSLPYTSGGT